MSDMTSTFAPKVRATLQKGYTRAKMTAAMSDNVPKLYEGATGYLNAILDAFYSDLPSDDASPLHRVELSLRDRERVLIAILASQNDGAALAIHMYSAIMEGITNGEIAHILMLAGAYTGVSHFTRALFVQKVLIEVLTQVASDPTSDLEPKTVVGKILQRFEPSLMPPPKPGT
jgi:alkylhydroperoxidase/carboxymuconolactone decarboxylase family protein YurZ